MIKVLKNPKTEKYYNLKNKILSGQFPWFHQRYTSSQTMSEKLNFYWYKKGYIAVEGYSHCFLARPDGEDKRFSRTESALSGECISVLTEIIDNNNLFDKYFFVRVAANCIHSNQGIQLSQPHEDHEFPHHNLIVYLTNSGGETFVENESHDPKEDDTILFTGEHYMKRPIKDRRIILIATIFSYDVKKKEEIK